MDNGHGFINKTFFSGQEITYVAFSDPDPENKMYSSGMIASEITYIGEWDFTQYRRNAPFLMTI